MAARTLRRSLFALALASSAAPLSAQLAMSRTDGVLGSGTTYELQGQPGGFVLMAPSVTTGPLPLSLFDISDTRFLDVGFELFPLNLWTIGFLDGSGQATLTYGLPATNPNLHGLPFYAQAVELVFLPSLFGEISNRCDVSLTMPGMSVNALGPQVEELDAHTATTLLDGRILMAGGITQDGLGGSIILDSFQLYDPNTESYSASSATMQHPRQAHTATRLPDGRVLLLGGSQDGSVIVSTGDIYDPVTDSCSPIPDMAVPRVLQTATLLDDGRVLVVGGLGTFDFVDVSAALNSATSSCEIYDPISNSWSPAPALPNGRVGHGASKLGDGRVLITGGLEVAQFVIPIPSISNDCRRYDPGTNSWLATASFDGDRALHAQVTLPNGDALIGGGADGNIVFLSLAPIDTTRRYDHVTNTWTNTASLQFARAHPNLLYTGSELVMTGGVSVLDITTLTGVPTQQIEVTDLGVLSWTHAGDMILGRELALSTVIDDGQRILTTARGLTGGTEKDFTSEIFAP